MHLYTDHIHLQWANVFGASILHLRWANFQGTSPYTPQKAYTPGPGIPLLSLRAPCSLKIAPKQPISIYLLGPLVAKYEIDNGVPWDLAQNPIPPSFVQIQFSNLLSKGSSSNLLTRMTLPAPAICYSRKRTTSLCLVVEKGSSSIA